YRGVRPPLALGLQGGPYPGCHVLCVLPWAHDSERHPGTVRHLASVHPHGPPLGSHPAPPPERVRGDLLADHAADLLDVTPFDETNLTAVWNLDLCLRAAQQPHH